MYGIISFISFIIRQFLLPNPFKNILGTNWAEIVNLIFGGVFVAMAYTITGSWYSSRKELRWLGSLGFFINYCLMTGITIVISKFVHNIYIIAGIIIVIFLLLCLIERKMFSEKNPLM